MTSLPSSRIGRAVSCCALALPLCFLSGCQSAFLTNWSESFTKWPETMAHWSESTTINGLAAGIAAENAKQIRQVTSSDFSTSLLAGEDTFEDIEKVWPVTGELKVVAVEEVPKEERQNPEIPEKMITIKDERGLETYGRLILAPETGEWVVDEILITARQRGISVTKTVSEQIAFQRVVEDFAAAWREGERKARLAHVTPACRKELEALPDSVLDHVAGQMFPPGQPTINIDRAMDEDIAVVRLRHPSGTVLLEMKRLEGEWLIDDAAYQSGTEGETIPSLRNTAIAYAAATDFLRAYAAGDLETLQKVTVKSFFQSTLKVAKLSAITLPPVSAAKSGRLRLIGGTGELVITKEAKTFKIALTQTNDESEALLGTEFRVEDVTIYTNDGRHKKTLAAALVAEPTAGLFVKALVHRNLHRLKAMSTHDFSVRVWNRVSGELMPELPLALFDDGQRKMLSVLHKGQATEVTMMQAGRAMTVVLHDEKGEIKVDDVIVAVADRPSSTKKSLAQYVPVARMVDALKRGDLTAIREQCTRDFNYSIWSQVRQVPAAAKEALRFLDGTLRALETSQKRTTVQLGKPGQGSRITMLKFDGQWKINEITLITGKAPGQRLALKDTLRHRLATGTLREDRPLLADSAESGTMKSASAAGDTVEPVAYEAPVAAETANAESRDSGQPRPVPLSGQGKPAVKLSPVPKSPRAPALDSGQATDSPAATTPDESSEKSATPKEAKAKPQEAAVGPAAPFAAPLW